MALKEIITNRTGDRLEMIETTGQDKYDFFVISYLDRIDLYTKGKSQLSIFIILMLPEVCWMKSYL